MLTALNAPLSALDPGEANFVSQVREHGWFGTHVSAEDGKPGFSYTSGFWLSVGAPEVVIFSVKSNVAHDIFWEMYRDLKTGMAFPVRRQITGIFGNYKAVLFPIATQHFPTHLGWSRWFYGTDEFPCVQLVWPDKAGVFPWESSFDGRFAGDQPDLSEDGWAASIAH